MKKKSELKSKRQNTDLLSIDWRGDTDIQSASFQTEFEPKKKNRKSNTGSEVVRNVEMKKKSEL